MGKERAYFADPPRPPAGAEAENMMVRAVLLQEMESAYLQNVLSQEYPENPRLRPSGMMPAAAAAANYSVSVGATLEVQGA